MPRVAWDAALAGAPAPLSFSRQHCPCCSLAGAPCLHLPPYHLSLKSTCLGVPASPDLLIRAPTQMLTEGTSQKTQWFWYVPKALHREFPATTEPWRPPAWSMAYLEGFHQAMLFSPSTHDVLLSSFLPVFKLHSFQIVKCMISNQINWS